MSSFTRRMQRRKIRAAADYEPKPQVTIITDDGYRTLHPTRGWRRVSQRQIEGRRIIDELRQAAAMKALMRPAVVRAPKVWNHVTRPLPEGTMTRQRLRAERRNGGLKNVAIGTGEIVAQSTSGAAA